MLDIRAQGDLFGGLAVLGQPRYPESAAAQTACCVLVIARDDFRNLLQSYPDVALNVVDGLARELAAAHDSIEAISTMSVDARVTLVLLRLADRLGQPDDSGILIQSALSQQDLAAMVSTTPETVSRVISGLRRSGHVETGRRWIRIRDRATLARLAEGDGHPH
ncbi:MAG: Crp/Fnr family transcriptional regulator [Halofilum sp. (in: g-proteobacteria)]|nr:Crp/Fnr family transcriptional regulator [Halofilum sp. (in: g-proteobacteria)]